jgi:hypothetical protein
MDFEEQQKKARQVVAASKKVIAEAENALKRTERYLADNNINADMLMHYLKTHVSPDAEREINLIVERTMRDVREEADRVIEESRKVQAVPSARRKFRTLI